jgi:hypothetical protein
MSDDEEQQFELDEEDTTPHDDGTPSVLSKLMEQPTSGIFAFALVVLIIVGASKLLQAKYPIKTKKLPKM